MDVAPTCNALRPAGTVVHRGPLSSAVGRHRGHDIVPSTMSWAAARAPDQTVQYAARLSMALAGPAATVCTCAPRPLTSMDLRLEAVHACAIENQSHYNIIVDNRSTGDGPLVFEQVYGVQHNILLSTSAVRVLTNLIVTKTISHEVITELSKAKTPNSVHACAIENHSHYIVDNRSTGDGPLVLSKFTVFSTT